MHIRNTGELTKIKSVNISSEIRRSDMVWLSSMELENSLNKIVSSAICLRLFKDIKPKLSSRFEYGKPWAVYGGNIF